VSFAGDNAVLHRQLAAVAAQVAELRTVRVCASCPHRTGGTYATRLFRI
jgi:hypothetical protein